MKHQDFLGKTLSNLYVKTSDVEGTTVDELFLELDNEIVIEPPNDEYEVDAYHSNDFKTHEDAKLCNGSSIVKLLNTECLPYFGILLSNNKVIYCDSANPYRFEWYIGEYDKELIDRYEFN